MIDVPQSIPHGEPLGVDVGLHHFCATSDGGIVSRPRFFVDLQRKLKLLQKRVSRKKLGAKNWRKATEKVALLHEKIANIRVDFHRKTAHSLCDKAGMIFVEDLNLKGLAAGMLSKHCLDAAWVQFFLIIEQICFKRGVFFMKIAPHKTSQICPNCLVETGKKGLGERVHICSSCGFEADRDVAAAQVIALKGLAAVGHTVKMLAEGKVVGLPAKQESRGF